MNAMPCGGNCLLELDAQMRWMEVDE